MILLEFGVKSLTGSAATEQFRDFHIFAPSQFFTTCPWYLVPFGSIFCTLRPESIWSMLYSFKRMLQIDFWARLLKTHHFYSIWDSNSQPKRVPVFAHPKPEPLLGLMLLLSLCLIGKFCLKRIATLFAFHYRSNDISDILKAFSALWGGIVGHLAPHPLRFATPLMLSNDFVK